MGSVIATAGTVPMPPRAGHIDFTPLVTVIVSLLVVRFLLGVRMTWPVVGIVIVLGTVLGWAIGAWGVVTPTAIAFLGAVIVTGQFRRRSGRASSA
jgi:hypothetical protein